jgi:hypothetical protein
VYTRRLLHLMYVVYVSVLEMDRSSARKIHGLLLMVMQLATASR